MKAAIALLVALAAVPVCAGLTQAGRAQLVGLNAVSVQVNIQYVPIENEYKLGLSEWIVKAMQERDLTQRSLKQDVSGSLRDAGLVVADTTGGATLVLDVFIGCASQSDIFSYMGLRLNQAAYLKRDSAQTLGSISLGEQMRMVLSADLIVKAIKSFEQSHIDDFVADYRTANGN